MNTEPGIPPVIAVPRSIRYELTRWDLFANFASIFLRNQIARIMVIVFLILNAGIRVGPGLGSRPISRTVFDLIVYSIIFFGAVLFFQCVIGFAMAFLLKQKGVAGQHVLEITEQGLIERTEYNETLHKWTSIGRIVSICNYLYIYIGDNNSHQVPKRQFSVGEINAFEADLRARVRGNS